MKKLFMIIMFAFTASIFAAHAQAQVIVIANEGVKAADMSKSDLRDVFTGVTSALKGGSHVAPVLLKQGQTSDEFLHTYLGKNDVAFRAGWRNLVFSGQATMPKSFDSETAMVEYVTHNTGAIGYISKSTPHEGVKVLPVR